MTFALHVFCHFLQIWNCLSVIRRQIIVLDKPSHKKSCFCLMQMTNMQINGSDLNLSFSLPSCYDVSTSFYICNYMTLPSFCSCHRKLVWVFKVYLVKAKKAGFGMTRPNLFHDGVCVWTLNLSHDGVRLLWTCDYSPTHPCLRFRQVQIPGARPGVSPRATQVTIWVPTWPQIATEDLYR